MIPMLLPLLLLFSIRVDPADPDLVAGLQDLARANAAAAAAPPAPQPPPPPPQPHWQPPALRGRLRWGESAGSLPPPISSLRRRPALVRTRTGDGRLVITHRGEGSGGRGGLVCTRRREGEGHLTMRLL
ncbi:hypothetical protein BAE44_0012249 [Dichanthelium oligosanthes]|uniref:Uncharacterized protein n=1 Tax=Dichanthelium oligosanthes TaxID=888268 RepID=A0A1E5VNS4_9POAL|nr:hypothetical protein BAE44_0012249 [Dichanthelium oligosanthes]